MSRCLPLALLHGLIVISGCAERALPRPELTSRDACDLAPADAGADLAFAPDLFAPDLSSAPDLSTDLSAGPDLARVDLNPSCSDCTDAAPQGSLTLLAGHLGGWGNADGNGAAARFFCPSGVANDGAGHLFVADENNNSVRQIAIATGAVTTLAGGGPVTTANNTGPAATLSDPVAVAADGDGNVYVAENTPGTIRKIVVATGEVTTLAGTPFHGGSADGIGAAASFSDLYGLACDGAGNLYVADDQNPSVRKIVIATGEVTTMALVDGTGAKVSLSAYGITADGAGNLYVADGRGNVIRKIVIATGVTTTLAGTLGVAGSTDGIGAAALFNFPIGITSDGAGNVYVGDGNNYTIRKLVVATGQVTTLAGSVGQRGSADGTGAAARFSYPAGMTSDGAGNLYVADWFNTTIRRIVATTREVTTLAGAATMPGSADGTGAAATFSKPVGIAGDGAGNLYVVDSGDLSPWGLQDNFSGAGNTVRKVAIASGVVTTLAGTAGVSGISDGIGAAASFDNPEGADSDGAGNLYVDDQHYSGAVNSVTRKVAIASGAVSSPAIPAGPGWSDGAGHRYSVSGGFYLSSVGVLYRTALATGEVTTLPITDASGAPASVQGWLTGDGAGNLYLANNFEINQIVLATGVMTTLAGSASAYGSTDGIGASARFGEDSGGVSGIVSDGAGNLYVADPANHTVRKVVIATGAVTTVVGVPGHVGAQPGPLPASLNCPTFLAFINGDLAITDTCENAVLITHLRRPE